MQLLHTELSASPSSVSKCSIVIKKSAGRVSGGTRYTVSKLLLVFRVYKPPGFPGILICLGGGQVSNNVIIGEEIFIIPGDCIVSSVMLLTEVSGLFCSQE
jgi:hypothetical protein